MRMIMDVIGRGIRKETTSISKVSKGTTKKPGKGKDQGGARKRKLKEQKNKIISYFRGTSRMKVKAFECEDNGTRQEAYMDESEKRLSSK